MKQSILLLAFAAVFAAEPPPAQPQVTDPRLVFSTYHGGDRNDDGVAVAVDPSGNVYMTGETESNNLEATPVGGKPITGAVFKGYLVKYSPQGHEVLWRALIGGASNTVPHAIALDRDGNVYVAGTTGARDLPLKNPVQDKQTGLNICFLMKFSPEGELLFSTYFGGNRNEEGLALALDSQGAIYLAGRASSADLPVKNALQPQQSGGGQDAFIAKFTADYQLAYATYLGGSAGTDNIHAIAVGPDDSLYVAGDTMSPALATPGAWQQKPTSYSGFLARLTPAGDALTYFTYVGWPGGYTNLHGLAVDAEGRAYAVGETTSHSLPTTENALQPTFAGGMRDAFLLRLAADGSAADYLTYLGGSSRGPTDPDESASAVAIDAHGLVYVTGHTNSPDFPGVRPFQPLHAGKFDAFLLHLDLDNREIRFASFWGGEANDAALALTLGPGEAVTVAGRTNSAQLPVANATQPERGSTDDAFLAQFCDPWPAYWLGDLSELRFSYTLGGPALEALKAVVYTGCPQAFDATAPESDQPWLTVAADAATAPLTLTFTANPDGLEPGEYRATVRLSIPAAFKPVLEIPVVLIVSAPPAEDPAPPEETPAPVETRSKKKRQ